MKKEKLYFRYDKEGDLLIIRLGKPTKSYYHGLGNDIFQRIDGKTKKVKGYMIVNFNKLNQKNKHMLSERGYL